MQNVSVRSLSAVAVNVSWSRDSEDISSFRVYYFASGGGQSQKQSPTQSPTPPVVFPGNASWGVIDGLRSRVEYQFQVAAVIAFPGPEREGLRSQAVSVGEPTVTVFVLINDALTYIFFVCRFRLAF